MGMEPAWLIRRLVAALMVNLALAAPLAASPAQPTPREVEALLATLRLRDGLITRPEETIAALGSAPARDALAEMAQAMQEAGSGADGWRFLMATSVFDMVGAEGPGPALTLYYNPWTDNALIAEWRERGGTFVLADAEWLPADLIRVPGGEVDPRPPWLRTGDARSRALSEGMIAVIDAFEANFGTQAARRDWRGHLGLEDRAAVAKYLAPVLALRIYESQLRIKALAVPAEGEDPLLAPLRKSLVALIRVATSQGFAPLVERAPETAPEMAAMLTAMAPVTLEGLAPVALVADRDEVLVYLASPLTSDFTIAARFGLEGEAATVPRLRQLDLVLYAASVAMARLEGPAAPVTTPAMPAAGGGNRREGGKRK
ncbi:MAG TPA: hypothetical protein ENJ52_05295 [Aliiroseovarius sp.]|nr:hypothetical protein [Aliiroseovarius sp.]